MLMADALGCSGGGLGLVHGPPLHVSVMSILGSFSKTKQFRGKTVYSRCVPSQRKNGVCDDGTFYNMHNILPKREPELILTDFAANVSVPTNHSRLFWEYEICHVAPIPGSQCALQSDTLAAEWWAEPSSSPPSAVREGTYLAMGFAYVRAVTKNVAAFLSTRPNISESHSEISTRVPFCITGAVAGRSFDYPPEHQRVP